MVSRNIKAIPLLVTLLLSVLYVLFNPNIANELSFYLSHGAEDGFGTNHGWAMYAFLIPTIGAVLGRSKMMWRYIVILALFPIALCFSYWLWELLGWGVMGVVLVANAMMFFMGNNDDFSKDWTAIAMYCLCAAYAVLRVSFYFANEALLPVFDIAFMGLSALVCVVDTVMVFGGWIPSNSMYGDDADLSAKANFYYFIVFAALLYGLSVLPLNPSKPTQLFSQNQTDQQEKTTTYVCTANTLNVRNMPNSSSQTIGKVTKGKQVEVYGFVNDFAEINYYGRKGYVSRKYITPLTTYNTSSTANNNQNSTQTTSQTQAQSIIPIPADAKNLHAGHMTSEPQVDDTNGDKIYAVTQGPGYITVWFVIPRFNTFEVSSRTYLTAQNGSQNIKLKVKEMGEWRREKGYVKFKLDVHHGEDYSSDRLFGLIFDEIDPSITTITIKDEKRNWAWTGIHLKTSK